MWNDFFAYDFLSIILLHAAARRARTILGGAETYAPFESVVPSHAEMSRSWLASAQVKPYSFMSMSAASLRRFSRKACRASGEMLSPLRSMGTSESFIGNFLRMFIRMLGAVFSVHQNQEVQHQFQVSGLRRRTLRKPSCL
jgi:hypothetical protein